MELSRVTFFFLPLAFPSAQCIRLRAALSTTKMICAILARLDVKLISLICAQYHGINQPLKSMM